MKITALGSLLVSILFVGGAFARPPSPAEIDRRTFAPPSPPVPSTSSPSLFSNTASDTFYLYGAPGSLEGTFEDILGQPDWNGWTTHDPTENAVQPRWHASQINCGNLDPTPGNWGVISHHEGSDYVGYGNMWDDRLEFRFDPSVLDPSFDPAADTTTVRLRFHYNHFLEPNYDYLYVEYETGAAWQVLFSQDGGDGSAQIFDSEDHGGIVFLPAEYDSTGNIVLRLRVITDGAWSDEDGLFSTGGLGAAAIDSILVEVNGSVVSVADWEPLSGKLGDLPEGSVEGHDNGAGPGTSGWLPAMGPFAGDFAKLFSNLADHDPCTDNASVVAGFIDDGTPPNNAPGVSTGGSQCASSGYPWVVNYTDGISGADAIPIHNQIWSPAIPWDLPGPDDDTDIGGVILQYDAYYDFPFSDGIFSSWHMRYYTIAEGWRSWKSDLFYYGSNIPPQWKHEQIDLTRLFDSFADVESVQVALGVIDAAEIFQLPGNCATIAPLYDNVSLAKIRPAGPRISLRDLDSFQDGFPADGTLTGPVRLDMARDIAVSFPQTVPGDSMVVSIQSITPGRALADSATGGVLHVAHLVNPYFATERAAALAQLGATLEAHDPQSAWPVYVYEVAGSPATTATGVRVWPRYFFDLPDGPADLNAPHQADEPPLFFGGDVMHWYVEAADDQGGVTTLPADLGGFLDFGPSTVWPAGFTLHALPKLDDSGQQLARTLIWDDNFFSFRGDIYRETLGVICWNEGIDYDVYRTRAPNSGVGNGLGASHHRGAVVAQLDGYDRLVYLAGTQGSQTISDGSGSYPNDKADDLALLQGWLHGAGERSLLLFGDNLAGALSGQGSATTAFLHNDLGVDFIDSDVAGQIGGQTNPGVQPTSNNPPGWFTRTFSADGGCPSINTFDTIDAFGAGPRVSHGFLNPVGDSYLPPVVAGVWWERQENGWTKRTGFHPFDLSFIAVAPGGSRSLDLVTRGEVLQEMLMITGATGFCATVGTGDTPAWRFELSQNHPNPFNPRTSIRFTAPAAGHLKLEIFDARGRRIATLHNGPVEAGIRLFHWNGTDLAGRPVASGVYFYRAEGFGRTEVRKMALLR